MGGKRKAQTMEAKRVPLDYAILKTLPDEGERLGFNYLGETVRSLARKLNKELPTDLKLTPDTIGGRLKAMQYDKLVVSVKVLPVDRGLGWQITAKGKKLLKEEGSSGT